MRNLSLKSVQKEWQSLFENAGNHAPYTLWQWMNGCVTKEGITYDLEAFKKAGIDSVQQFLVGGSEADITDPEIMVLGDKWMELMRFALDECKRLEMTFGTHNCPGWSASGAPGILPEDSMQKIVWTKTMVRSAGSLNTVITAFEPDPKWKFYRDICVVAIPAGSEIISKEAVLVLLDGLDGQHKLTHQLPAGEWVILRFGHTLTGHMNLTAPVSGQGLEIDKMSKEALEKFWALYPAKLITMAGDHVGKTFKRLELDSFEAGEQTWTSKMPEEFRERCGYDLLQWLPSMAGFTIESKELTARFKYDWRRTITSLITDNYYGHLAKLTNQAGLDFLVEPYATGRVNFDINSIRGIGDIFMCEFWYGPTTWGWDSILPVASNAHVNGKKIVAAEAFTGQPQFAWKVDLFDLKQPGDRAFCNGVNLFVLHASAHQPWPNAKPGMTMGWWGTQFGPSQTWWTHGAPEWIEYVSRCQTILQKGLFVADICFLHLSRQKDPLVPAGYKADICNPKEFLQRFIVEDKKWVLPDGMNYRILVLPTDCSIDLAVAKKIKRLVTEGGIVIGNGFKGAAGLKGRENDEEMKSISESLFGSPSSDGILKKEIRSAGKGKVYVRHEIQEVLKKENIKKDIDMPESERQVLWIHRKDGEQHHYFISNQSDTAREIRISFRVTGLLPELLNPETGSNVNAPFWDELNGITTVQLRFESYGSTFVVFRKPVVTKNGLTVLKLDGKATNPFDYFFIKDNKFFVRLKEPGNFLLVADSKSSLKKTQTEKPFVKELNTDWNISFEQNKGAPSGAHFDKLISLSEHNKKEIRFFSGKASYSKSFTLTADQLSKTKGIFIDLGIVKNVATIIVNGKKIRTFWKPPFAAEITAWCQIGKNILEVQVTNLWPNRLIGDEMHPEDLVWGEERYFNYVTPKRKICRNLQVVPDWVKHNKERPSKSRVAFTTTDFFDKDDPLLPSGLIGPVTLSIDDIWELK